MRKCIVIILIAVLSFSSCSNAKTTILPTMYSSGNTTSVPSKSTSPYQKYDSTSSENFSEIDANTSLTENKKATCGAVQFHFTCQTIDDLIEWTKRGGTSEIGKNGEVDNVHSDEFLAWRKTQKEFSIPRLKNHNFNTINVEIMENKYFVRYHLKPDASHTPPHNLIFLYGYVLSDEEQKMDLDALTVKFKKELLFPYQQNEKPVSGNSRWGEYRTVSASENGPTAVWFVHTSILVCFYAFKNDNPDNKAANWQEEYFNYFDFETVSLE